MECLQIIKVHWISLWVLLPGARYPVETTSSEDCPRQSDVLKLPCTWWPTIFQWGTAAHLLLRSNTENKYKKWYLQVRDLPRMQIACSPTAVLTIHGPSEIFAMSFRCEFLYASSPFRNRSQTEPSSNLLKVTKCDMALKCSLLGTCKRNPHLESGTRGSSRRLIPHTKVHKQISKMQQDGLFQLHCQNKQTSLLQFTSSSRQKCRVKPWRKY